MRRYLKYLFLILTLSTSVISLFGQTYVMGSGQATNNATITTCSGTFYDSGGANSNYANNENRTVTFCSSIPGQAISLSFSQFNIESGWDVMYIYDGPNTASPLIRAYSGTAINNVIWAPSGCITINFISDNSVTSNGWAATIGCGTVPIEPNCITTTPAGNSCLTATPICDFNGYCGNTSSSYTANSWWGLFNAFAAYGAYIDNNSFFSFVAGATTVSLDVWVSNCTSNFGIQFMVFSSAGNCSGYVTSYFCESQMLPGYSAIIASGLTIGNTYYLMVDGFAGDVCDYTVGASLSSGILLPVSLNSNAVTICDGDSTTLTASGGNGVYNWSPSTGLSTTTGSTVIASPTVTTTYTVSSFTGNSSCPTASTEQVVVTVSSLNPTFANVGPYCYGSAIPALPTTSTNGITGTWSPAINNTATTTYTFTPNQGQCATTATLTIQINPQTSISSAVNQTVCVNNPIADISLVTTGAIAANFTGLPPGLIGSLLSDTVIISGAPTLAGTFNYTVTINGGVCPPATATTTGTITVTPLNTIAPGTNQTVCVNSPISSINLATTGASNAIFSGLPPGILGTWAGNTAIISGIPTATGTFYYTVSTTGGCPSATTGTIIVNTIPSITLTNTDVTCVGANDGTANIYVPGSNVGGTISLLSYCSSNPAPNFITQPQTIIEEVQLSGDNFSINNNTGGVNDFYEDYSPILYADVTEGQNYTVNVTPSDIFAVTGQYAPEAINVYIDFNIDGDFLDAGEDLGVINIPWGSGNISAWTPGTVYPFNFTVPTTGFYGPTRMRVVCMSNANWPGAPVTMGPCESPTGANIPWFGATEDYSIVLNSPTTNVSYLWSTGSTSDSIYGLTPGTYSVIATNINGCVDTAATVIGPGVSNITPIFTAVGPYCSGAVIPALPTTSINGITGTWSPSINHTATTIYTFTPDSGQCAITETMIVTINPVPTVSLTASPDPACLGSDITLYPVSSAGSSYRFQYNTGAGWTNLTTPAWSAVNPQTYPNISGATDFRVMVREASDCNNSPWSNIITVPVITIVTPPIAHN